MNNSLVDRVIEIELNNSLSNIHNLDQFIQNIVGDITRNLIRLNDPLTTSYTIEYEILTQDGISEDILSEDIVTGNQSPSPITQKNINILLDKYRKIKEDDIIVKKKLCCPICLEEFKPNEYKRTLNCNHLFHKRCIDKWIKVNNTCPVCRLNCLVI